MEKIIGRTPSGEEYEMRIEEGKVLLELLQYKMTFEPQLVMRNGKIAFVGTVQYRDKERELVIVGSDETVRWFERAKDFLYEQGHK